MNLERLRDHWNHLGETDPMWAVLTDPHKRHRGWNKEDFFAHGEREVSGVLEYLASRGIESRSGHALDFGCGVGRISQALCGHFTDVTGVDIAPSMVREAESLNRHGGRCSYIVNSAPNLEILGPKRFDFVYSNIVLQHMEPAFSLGYIREFARVLAPGGLALFQIPSEPAGNAGGLMLRILPPAVALRLRGMEMHGVPPARVEAALREAGAVLIDRAADSNAGPNWIGYRYLAIKPEVR